jgi:hypothetical protein
MHRLVTKTRKVHVVVAEQMIEEVALVVEIEEVVVKKEFDLSSTKRSLVSDELLV